MSHMHSGRQRTRPIPLQAARHAGQSRRIGPYLPALPGWSALAASGVAERDGQPVGRPHVSHVDDIAGVDRRAVHRQVGEQAAGFFKRALCSAHRTTGSTDGPTHPPEVDPCSTP